ncbi:hypothetical protein G6011_05072 [Alternaria panax]|uniref:Uncharacterized protein n=1 Tax=Alternaria panax TaxID=48097 RepID=A0AAD4FDW6_9PLEO|nr:hypothetical protein G6011_05072 [Alternaria panax]
MRQVEEAKRGKQKNFRKCYIALKVISVPCNSDGTARGQYTPRTKHHPFDTALPQVGDNFFEDVLIVSTGELDPANDNGANAPAPAIADHTDVNSSPANLGEDGEKWLRFTQYINRVKRKALPLGPKPTTNAVCTTRSRPAGGNPPVVRNADTTLSVPAQGRRKRPIVIDEDEDEDYVDTPEEAAEALERSAKRQRKSTITTPPAPAAKKKKKNGRPMKSTISTPMAPASKLKRGMPMRKRS